MLIMTRKAGQSIIIDKDIVVTVLETKGMQVKIGIEAPREITVDREEIHIKKENSAKTNKG